MNDICSSIKYQTYFLGDMLMEKEKNSVSKSCNKEGLCEGVAQVPIRNSGVIETPFETDESEGECASSKLDSVLANSVERLSGQLESISGDVSSCRELLLGLAREVDELKAADQIVTDLGNRCRDLSEQFHEREVLLPIIYCLIRMTDGCRQQIDKFQNLLAKHPDSRNEAATKALKFLIDARKADLVELDSTLANLGVELYEHHEEVFAPSLQKCINRIECRDKSLEGGVARRLLPGYRRHDRIVRKEYVNVYVRNKMNNF
jgi:molecular chaperone GrpE (heat shock protein)